VLVRVAAAGVNGPDIKQRQGHYPPPKGASDLPGLEVAGTVAARGSGVDEWKEGDAVCALANGGGYAEYCTVPAGQCLPVPKGLGMIEAAALPETFFTVWNNVAMRAGLHEGESFLVHGGAGGIGSTAIQIAKALGARVFATASSPEKCDVCRQLGADRAINYTSEDFVDVVRAEAPGGGVNVILDMIGGGYVARNIKALAADGRLVHIAFDQGSTVEVNLMPVMLKRLTYTGSTLRTRSPAFKSRIAQELETRVWPLIESGRIRVVTRQTFPLAEAERAHALMESAQHTGKILLTVS
jgi:putative PIG3 family NAD(P)H quinone oxidoreductase